MPRTRLPHLNTLQILQLIRAYGSISRSQVAEKTGASPFLVAKICDHLLALAFYHRGRSRRFHGRPAARHYFR